MQPPQVEKEVQFVQVGGQGEQVLVKLLAKVPYGQAFKHILLKRKRPGLQERQLYSVVPLQVRQFVLQPTQ